MGVSGVICEFNPFHNGHAYLLSRMREEVGDEGCVICLMSGRFVQRGEVAIADPYLRGQMALAGGADLVLELPFPWSAAGAEHFAAAGVYALARLGVDTLTFGSERGDLSLLSAAAEVPDLPCFGAVYAELCNAGMGTATAYVEALRRVSSCSLPADFPASNDLLGIAYLRAIRKVRAEQGITLVPRVITRLGSGYRENTLTEGMLPSATALRILLREASCDPVVLPAILEGSMPDKSLTCLTEAIARGEAPTEGDRLLPFLHTLYRLKSPADMEGFAEWGGGLAGHICRHARRAATPDTFFDSLRTKQYTDARLRRALLFGAIGVTEQDLRTMPVYTTLLAANKRGRAYLKAYQKGNRDHPDGFPVVTKPADAPDGRQRELSDRADGLFTLCFPTARDAGDLYRRGPFIQE